MKEFMEHLQNYLAQHSLDLGDNESVLSLLYEAYSEVNPMDDPQIKGDFNQLYEQMNGMTLKEMDRIIYPVCTLCRDRERSGFVHGVKVGVALAKEIEGETSNSLS